jgi:hypothetical protein
MPERQFPICCQWGIVAPLWGESTTVINYSRLLALWNVRVGNYSSGANFLDACPQHDYRAWANPICVVRKLWRGLPFHNVVWRF